MIRPVFILSVQFTVICSDEHPNVLSLILRHQDIMLANHRLVQRWHFYHTCYHVYILSSSAVTQVFFFHIQTGCVLKFIEPSPSVIEATKTDISGQTVMFFYNHMVFEPEPNGIVVTRETENSTWTNFKLCPVWVRLWFYRIVANISSGDWVGLIPQQCLIWLHF